MIMIINIICLSIINLMEYYFYILVIYPKYLNFYYIMFRLCPFFIKNFQIKYYKYLNNYYYIKHGDNLIVIFFQIVEYY